MFPYLCLICNLGRYQHPLSNSFPEVPIMIRVQSLQDSIYVYVYVLHLFTQGKSKQLTLVFTGALHSFHKIVTNMYVQSMIKYSQIART